MMVTKRMFFLTLFLIISAGELAIGQLWTNSPIWVKGYLVNYQVGRSDSIQIIHYPDCSLFSEHIQRIAVGSNGSFRFELPASDHPSVLMLNVVGNSNLFMRRYVYPGDSIDMRVELGSKRPKATFFGYTAVRFACEDSLDVLLDRFNQLRAVKEGDYKDRGRIAGDYQKLYRLYAYGYTKALDLLDSFKSSIGELATRFIRAQYARHYLSPWELGMRDELDLAAPVIKDNIIKGYMSYKYPDYDIDKVIAAYSESFLQHQLEKSRTELYIQNRGNGFSFKELFSYLKNNYSGILRERLLVYFLYDYRSSLNVVNYDAMDYNECLSEAQSLVRSASLKKLLAEKSVLKKGTPVFEFSLPDTSGNFVSLHDLKGKVILLDVWATGCSGCAQFSRFFEEKMYPLLKDRTDFTFLSVNANETVKGWNEGINSGKYTHKHHLNVYLEGKSLSHPFARYYGINTIPFIMLIDRKGNVYSKIDISLSEHELTKLIESALDQK